MSNQYEVLLSSNVCYSPFHISTFRPNIRSDALALKVTLVRAMRGRTG